MNTFLYTLGLSVLLISCGGKKNPSVKKIEENITFFNSKITETPINKNSSSAKNIIKCANKFEESNNCKILETPFLGLETDKSSQIQNIIDKTIISRKWQGDNFKKFLEHNKDNKELFKLFDHTTGIVISHRLSNSFFISITGMIYIQAKYLYHLGVDLGTDKDASFLYDLYDKRTDNYTDEDSEKKVVNYLSMDTFRSKYYKLSSYSTDFSQMNLSLIRVLYHELSHAADFFAHTIQNSETLDRSLNFYDLFEINETNKNIISLKYFDPNTNPVSPMLDAFEKCALGGYSPHIDYIDCQFEVNKVVSLFKDSDRVSLYGFYTEKEHLATLMTHYLLLKNHNIIASSLFVETEVLLDENIDRSEKILTNTISLKITDPKPFESASKVYESIFSSNIDSDPIRNKNSFELKNINNSELNDNILEKLYELF